MKIYKYQELGIFFIPLMGAYVSGKKQEVSQKQSAIILLAGPIPGIIIGIVLYFLAFNFESSDLESAASIFIVLNALNLLPVYPLDGGQLLHRLVLDKYNILGKVFVIISTAVLTALGIAFLMIDIRFAFLLFFPIMMIMRMISDIQHERIEKKIEAEGVDLMKSYEDLSAEEYWRIRNLLIKYYPQLRDVKPSPPYEISPKEEQVITTIQGLLQRSLIEDLSVTGKFLILVIWISFFIVPILLMDPFANF
jgi:hypothetical protein